MRVILFFYLILLAMGGCTRVQTPMAVSHPLPITDGSIRYAIEPFLQEAALGIKRFEAYGIPGHVGLYAVIFDWEPYWSGSFDVVHVSSDHVDWHAEIDADACGCGSCEPTGNSIFSLRAVQVAGFDQPFVEVIDMTHMGNGSLYLYEIKGQKLIHLLTAWAYDSHGDEVIRGGSLRCEYIDRNHDGKPDLALFGTVDRFASFGERQIGAIPVNSERYAKQFLWESSSHHFIPVE